jgi:hypothetical protein
LLSAPAPFDAVEADEIDSSMHDKAPQRWNKYPDAPLGIVISKAAAASDSQSRPNPHHHR